MRLLLALAFAFFACGHPTYTTALCGDDTPDAAIDAPPDAPPDTPAQCRLIAIDGQSNARGPGLASEISPELAAPYPAVQLVTRLDGNSYPPAFVDTPLGALSPRVIGGAAKFGIELTMGRTLHERDPSQSWVFAKFALDSTSLAGDWNPTNPTNPNKFTLSVNWLLEQLAATGCVLWAYVWIQGENDAYTNGTASTYGANLARLVDELRARLGYVLFIYGRISINHPYPYVSVLRSQQEGFQSARPGVVMVDQDPFPLSGQHFTSAALVNMGNTYAQAVP